MTETKEGVPQRAQERTGEKVPAFGLVRRVSHRESQR